MASDLPHAELCPHCGHKLSATRWMPQHVEQLRDWWSRGLTAGQIVGKFGGTRSRSAILGKVARLGLQRGAGR